MIKDGAILNSLLTCSCGSRKLAVNMVRASGPFGSYTTCTCLDCGRSVTGKNSKDLIENWNHTMEVLSG